MSVQRKRSPWAVTAAGMLLGAISLGLAGCGGGDDTPFPPGNNGFNSPFAVNQLAPRAAQGQSSIAAGQGGQVSVTNLDPSQYNGVTGVLVTFPTGTSAQNQTFGVAVIPTAQGAIRFAQTNSPNALGGSIGFVNSIIELLIGPVRQDGTIDTENIPNVPLTTVIQLTEAQANFLNSQLGNQRQFDVFRVENGFASPDPGCEVQFVRENRQVTVTKCRGGRAIVTHRPRAHTQGGGNSG